MITFYKGSVVIRRGAGHLSSLVVGHGELLPPFLRPFKRLNPLAGFSIGLSTRFRWDGIHVLIAQIRVNSPNGGSCVIPFVPIREPAGRSVISYTPALFELGTN